MPRRPIQSSIRTQHENEADHDRTGEGLRAVMQHWPTGVAIVAVQQRGHLEPITVNSFLSVSLEPPQILISIAEKAAIRPMLDDVARFTISLLGADQARIAAMVADRMPMLQGLFTNDADPVVKDAIASLVCTTSQRHPAGDHVLYVAQVERAQLGRDAAPLVYLEGKYHKK